MDTYVLASVVATEKWVFLNWANPGLFYCLFSVFSNKYYNFYNKYMWKNVHPVYSVGIRTHDLCNMSLLP